MVNPTQWNSSVMWVFSLFPCVKWWSVVITDVAVRMGTDKVMHPVWSAEPLSWSMHVYQLWVHRLGRSPVVTSWLINTCAFLCGQMLLPFLQNSVASYMCSSPCNYATTWSLKYWKVFVEKRFLVLFIFLLLEQRKMWHFVIIRECSPFFHVAKLTNRVWLFSKHYLLASCSLPNWKKIWCFAKKYEKSVSAVGLERKS